MRRLQSGQQPRERQRVFATMRYWRRRYVPYLSRADHSGCALASRRSLVVTQHATQSRPATNPARLSSDAVDQPVPKTLVIALPMIVRDESLNGVSKVALTEWNHPVEALFPDRPHEPLGIGIGVGRLPRCQNDANPRSLEGLAHRRGPFPIAIADQHPVCAQEPVVCGVTLRATGRMNTSFGCGVDPTIWTRRDARSITNTV